jgi:hypothetical protein
MSAYLAKKNLLVFEVVPFALSSRDGFSAAKTLRLIFTKF